MPHFTGNKGTDQGIVDMSMGQHGATDDAARAQHVRVKNRRKRYLDLYPDYFKRPELELQGLYSPLSYSISMPTFVQILCSTTDL